MFAEAVFLAGNDTQVTKSYKNIILKPQIEYQEVLMISLGL